MSATGLHGILHYLIAKISKKTENIKRTLSNDFFYGFIVRGFLPDYDPFISLLIWLALGDLSTEKLAEIHETFHRTATHSIFFVITLIILGLILGLRSTKAKSITLGISTGVMLHILLDLPYMVGVAIFWPLIPQKIGLILGSTATNKPNKTNSFQIMVCNFLQHDILHIKKLKIIKE